MTSTTPASEGEVFPPYRYQPYRSSVARAPARPLVEIEPTVSETTGPGPVVAAAVEQDADLTTNAGTGSPAIGERIIVVGRVLAESGAALPRTLVEVWQANAAGRYPHRSDRHDSPLDPNFLGVGRCVTDPGGCYRFLTVRPGAYPWRNHANAWRPAHIHVSVMGPAVHSRLVTQMYFPGDPLHDLDPILNAVPAGSRHRLVAGYDHDVTEPEWALGYRFDIVVSGPGATPFEEEGAA